MTPHHEQAETADVATEHFEHLSASLLNEPLVEPGSGFGAVPGLRVGRKIFAMQCRGQLVVKLPRHRVDQLVAAGTAARFDARRDGRLMKEWATIPIDHRDHWQPLAAEALAFVGSQP